MSEIPPWLKKRPAADKAVDDYVKDGMTVGLGTGNAANMAVDRIASLVKKGYHLTLVSSSIQTEEYARSLGLVVSDISEVDYIDVTLDGADEVDPQLNMIKGLGGALLKEKILASMTEKEIIIIDDFKMVQTLGIKTVLPVEVCGFAKEITADRLKKLGCEPALRRKNGEIFITDERHVIYDCKFDSIESPRELQTAIDTIPGVVECGLFIDLAYAIEAYSENGTVREYRR